MYAIRDENTGNWFQCIADDFGPIRVEWNDRSAYWFESFDEATSIIDEIHEEYPEAVILSESDL